MTADALIKAAQNSLTTQGAARVRAAVASSRAPNTRRACAAQWLRFTDWMQSRNLEPLPAAPEQVAAYLADRAEDGIRPAALEQAAAIAQAHREAGQPNPCPSQGVRRALAGLVRSMGCQSRQASGLTAGRLPRVDAMGRKESTDSAKFRARVDCALVRVMRDGLLRRSEAAVKAAGLEGRFSYCQNTAQ